MQTIANKNKSIKRIIMMCDFILFILKDEIKMEEYIIGFFHGNKFPQSNKYPHTGNTFPNQINTPVLETNSPIWGYCMGSLVGPIAPALGVGAPNLWRVGGALPQLHRVPCGRIPPSGYCMGMCSMPIAPALGVGAPKR